MKLKLTSGNVAPRSGARKEYFYSGELNVFNDEVETDNENWIQQLRERGWTPVDEMTEEQQALYNPQQANVYEQGKLPDVFPISEATSEEDNEVEEEEEVDPIDDENYEEELDEENTDVEESKPYRTVKFKPREEPSELENMMSEALNASPRED